MNLLQSMRVFQCVADEGGFAAAARKMELTPAVVTRQIQDLEQSLGVRLLHRTTRKMSLTQAGEGNGQSTEGQEFSPRIRLTLFVPRRMPRNYWS